jgi:hypothetical protein
VTVAARRHRNRTPAERAHTIAARRAALKAARARKASLENPFTEVDTGDLIIGSLVLVALTAVIVWPGYQIRRLHQLQAQNAFRAGAIAGTQAAGAAPVAAPVVGPISPTTA